MRTTIRMECRMPICVQAYKTGFVNDYLHGLKADHVGNDVGQQTQYRNMKDKGLAELGDKSTLG